MSNRYIHRDPILDSILSTYHQKAVVPDNVVDYYIPTKNNIEKNKNETNTNFSKNNIRRGLLSNEGMTTNNNESGREKWNKLKSIIKNTATSNHDLKHQEEETTNGTANSNDYSSLTEQELAFLKMRKKYSNIHKNGNYSTSSSKAITPTPTSSSSSSSSSLSSFKTIVDAAIARARLRQDLSTRLSRLTHKEAQFLKEIVNDENVTKDQLEHADYVLNTDPLYQLHSESSSLLSSSKRSLSTRHIESMTSTSRGRIGTGAVTEAVTEAVTGAGRNKEILESRHDDDEVIFDVRNGHRIYIENGKDIEIVINTRADKSSSRASFIRRRKSVEMQKFTQNHIPTLLYTTYFTPSKYSYKSWSKYDINDMNRILGLPEKINESLQVLTLPMMSSLRKALPFAVAEDNFWLKYAMTRDGSSLHSLYNSIRQSSRTLLAIETVNGDVFGAFLSTPWRNHSSFYGSCEAFLWRLQQSRFTPTSSVEEQIQLESNIDIFKWSQENRNIQMSDDYKFVIGGGFPDDDDSSDDNGEWGLGIAVGADLFEGTTSKCCTFNSPSLSQVSSKGEIFEIANMEVWSFTPCANVHEAEQLEMGRMFVLSHFDQF